MLKIFTNIGENIPRGSVVTVGFFDGVHLGHRYLLQSLQRRASDRGVAALVITLWPHPALFFGRDLKLLTLYDEKLQLLEHCGIEHVLVLTFDANTAAMSFGEFNRMLASQLAVSEIVMGYNNAFGNKAKADMHAYVPIHRLDRYATDLCDDISSSEVRKCLIIGNIAKANLMLGYDYFLFGEVVSGNQIGRTLGFPTANIGAIDELKQVPADGVYAVQVRVRESDYHAVMNIGTRPTFGGGNRSLEFYIPDFSDDIYGEHVRLEFKARLRDEVRFANRNELIGQMQKDVTAMKKIFDSTR